MDTVKVILVWKLVTSKLMGTGYNGQGSGYNNNNDGFGFW